MADRPGSKYMRTTRGAYPGLYPASEQFPIGGCKVLKESPGDQVTLIGAGVTLHNCLAAAELLSKDAGIKPTLVPSADLSPLAARRSRRGPARRQTTLLFEHRYRSCFR